MIELKYHCNYLSNYYNNLTFYIDNNIKYVMQLGTYNGEDSFNKICYNLKNSEIILVEANNKHNKDIIENYKNIGNNNKIILINKAIVLGNYEKDTIDFYNYENEQQSSIIKDGSVVHENSNYKILKVNTIKFNNILKNHNFYNLELLMIDLEGLDYELLMDIDFSLIPNLKYLFFEGYHIDKKQKYIINNENAYFYVFGKKFKLLIDKLVENNYVLKIVTPDFYELLFEKVNITNDNYIDYLIDTKNIEYYKNNKNNKNNENSKNNYIFCQLTKLKTYFNLKLIEKYSFNFEK